MGYENKKKALQISVTPFSAESEVSSENATEWLVWAIFRIKVTTFCLLPSAVKELLLRVQAMVQAERRTKLV